MVMKLKIMIYDAAFLKIYTFTNFHFVEIINKIWGKLHFKIENTSINVKTKLEYIFNTWPISIFYSIGQG